MRATFHIVTILLALLLTCCTEPFDPPVSDREINLLVVDGFLNATAGTATVQLSYAKPLDSTAPYVTEQGAQVTLEGEDGSRQTLPHTGNGRYQAQNLSINMNVNYRITMRISGSKDYASDYVPVLTSPAIDSVTWTPVNTGISVRVNTHDDDRNTRYYQWRYTETWQYNAPQFSSYKYEFGRPILREPEEYLYTCWSTQPSTRLLVHTSNRLAEDVIRDFEVNPIPSGSVKISNRYSILVQQNAITREAYDFWTLLKQTTENLGGLFDPQPGKVIGNIRSLSDPAEPVLGYFQASTVTEKRIYIDFLQIPPALRYNEYREECRPDSLSLEGVNNFNPNIYHLVNAIYEGLSVVGYTYTRHPCADCRFDGGSLTKPDWWE